MTDGDTLHVEGEGHAEPAAEVDELNGRRLRLLHRGRQRVGRVPEIVLDPPRDVDAEPAKELQGLHRAAYGEREHNRDWGQSTELALVAVVGDEVLGGVEVVDDLGDEEPAARLLLRDQAQVLVLAAAMPLWNRHPSEQQFRVQL